jgi:hypothetical protein
MYIFLQKAGDQDEQKPIRINVNQTLVSDGENKTLLLIRTNAKQGKAEFWLLLILQNLWLSLQLV